MLNLKELRFRVHSTEPKIISVDVEREGIITGADIITDQDVEILNPDLTIATLEKGAHLKMEMEVLVLTAHAKEAGVPSTPEASIFKSPTWRCISLTAARLTAG